MKKKLQQVLVVLLAILLFFQTFEPGFRAIAYDTTASEATNDIFADMNTRLTEGTSPVGIDAGAEYVEETEEEIVELTGDDIIGELLHLREANVKHFRMSDGSFIAVTYDTDVHFQDEDGYWVDIDNSLTLEVAEDVPVTAATERLLDILEELLEHEEEIGIADIQEIRNDYSSPLKTLVFSRGFAFQGVLRLRENLTV